MTVAFKFVGFKSNRLQLVGITEILQVYQTCVVNLDSMKHPLRRQFGRGVVVSQRASRPVVDIFNTVKPPDF